MKFPGFSSVNVPASNPRLSAMRGTTKTFKAGSMILPLALLFTCGGIAFTMKWNYDRQQEGGVCVDCVRQKEMMDEVYFNKSSKPVMQKGNYL